MSTRAKIVSLALALAGCCTTPCFAHHGVAPHYDASKSVTVKGVVTRFDFINPHSFVYIETRDEQGAAQTWKCELDGRATLARSGRGADLFVVGQQVTLQGIAARSDPTGCAFRTATFNDGRVLQNIAASEPIAAQVPGSPAAGASVLGVWTLKRLDVPLYEGVMTAAGERARAAFDPVTDDPSMRCEPGSPIRVWVSRTPLEIRQGVAGVVIDYLYMDTTRVIRLDLREPPRDIEPDAMGYSIGRFEGASLVIETAAFSAGTLEPRRGVSHSAQMQLTETLAVNVASGELEVTWVIRDPVYFREPVVQTEYFVRAERSAERFDCQVP